MMPILSFFIFCYFFRFVFLAGFLARVFFAFLTVLFPAFRTFSLTIFLAASLGTLFTALFLAAFFAGLADSRPAGFEDLVAATATGAFTGLASAPSISRQPWASRTSIIADKMSFQVCCFIITSLGNMQPSQQM